MTRDELIQHISREYERLKRLLAGVEPEQLAAEPVLNGWTVKDILAHLAVWQSITVTNLFRLERGQPLLYVNLDPKKVDELNARFYQELKDWPPERVLGDLEGSYRQLINRISLLSEEELNDPRHFKQLRGRPLWQLIAANTYEHYAEHLPVLEAWRQRLG
ncbi:MAG: hypothetical protein C4316_09755 [Chloroflexota bacterium]